MKKHVFFAIVAAAAIGFTSISGMPVSAEEIAVAVTDETVIDIDDVQSPDVIYEEVIDLDESASTETESEIIVDLSEESELQEMEEVTEEFSMLEAGAISISLQPRDVTASVNSTATFSVQATGKNLTYKWQMSKDNGSTWISTSLSGYNTNTLSVKATTTRNNYKFRCIIKDSAGNSVTSSAAKLICSPSSDASSVVILRQSTEIRTPENAKISFVVAAEGSGLTYRWQMSKNGGSTWANTAFSGYNTATLSLEATAARNGYMFRCIVKDEKGKTVTSKPARLTVQNVQTKIFSLVNAAAGSTMSLHLGASVTGSAYQWQLSKNGGDSWYNTTLSGYNSDTLTLKATLARDNYMLRCRITNAKGKYVYSIPVKLQIRESSNENTYTIKTTLTVRTGPDKSYSATGLYASKGTKVTVYEEKNGWGKIRLNGKEGWISLKPEYVSHDHTYAHSSSSTLPGNCTDAAGVTVYNCSCGVIKREDIPVTGHQWSNVTDVQYVVDSQAWTEEKQTYVGDYFVCNVCGFSGSDAEVGDHCWDAEHFEGSTAISSYETVYIDHPEVGHYEEVVIGQKCSVCGAATDTPVTPAADHTHSWTETSTPGDCVTQGTKTSTCSKCGTSTTQNTGYGPHAFHDEIKPQWVIDQAAWTEEVQSYAGSYDVCNVCGFSGDAYTVDGHCWDAEHSAGTTTVPSYNTVTINHPEQGHYASLPTGRQECGICGKVQ